MLSSIPTTLVFSLLSLIYYPQPALSDTGFTYFGTKGPIDWPDLDKNYKPCGANEFQSPINFDSSWAANNTYRPEFSTLHVPPQTAFYNGHTFQVVMANSNLSTEFNGTQYKCMQHHFHTPSEHLVDGKHSDMEMHMLHQDSKGEYLVLSVPFNVDASESDPFVAGSIQNLGSIDGKANVNTTTGQLDLPTISNLFASSDIHTYPGSLTIPPCSAVRWVVAREPLHISLDDYKALKNVMGFNARPVQNELGQPNLLQLACNGQTNLSSPSSL